MPVISLDVRYLDYVSDQGISVRAQRVFAPTVYTTTSQRQVSYRSIVDSGAPLSVLPYSLWHDRNRSAVAVGGIEPPGRPPASGCVRCILARFGCFAVLHSAPASAPATVARPGRLPVDWYSGPAFMARHATDRNLLFVILALQM